MFHHVILVQESKYLGKLALWAVQHLFRQPLSLLLLSLDRVHTYSFMTSHPESVFIWIGFFFMGWGKICIIAVEKIQGVH